MLNLWSSFCWFNVSSVCLFVFVFDVVWLEFSWEGSGGPGVGCGWGANMGGEWGGRAGEGRL